MPARPSQVRFVNSAPRRLALLCRRLFLHAWPKRASRPSNTPRTCDTRRPRRRGGATGTRLACRGRRRSGRGAENQHETAGDVTLGSTHASFMLRYASQLASQPPRHLVSWDSARPGPVRLLLTFPGTASATRIPGRDPRWEGRGGRSRWSGGVQMSRAHLAAAFYGMAGASLTEGAAESGISPVSTPRPPAYDAERLK
jgi:hypothetical protein